MTTLPQEDQHNRRDNQQYRIQMQGKYQMRHIAQLLFPEKQHQQQGKDRDQQQGYQWPIRRIPGNQTIVLPFRTQVFQLPLLFLGNIYLCLMNRILFQHKNGIRFLPGLKLFLKDYLSQLYPKRILIRRFQ